MRVYLSKNGDYALYYLEKNYTPPPLGLMKIEKMKEKLEHNISMIEISSTLTTDGYDDIKNYANAKGFWDKLHLFMKVIKMF